MSLSTLSPPVQTRCAHCGEACGDQDADGQPAFCCSGCRTVYQLLRDNGLENFYRLDPAAGRSQRETVRGDYDWLATEALAASLARYHDDERWRVELELPAIHCIACVWLLERLPELLPGVRRSQVDVTRKRATIEFDPRQTNLRTVAELLAALGYPPVLRRAGREQARSDRSLLYRIGVAGFCFGNIMLLSFPEYLGLGDDAGETVIGRAMGPAMILLSLPVILYAAADFFRDAAAGLRFRRLTLDIPIVVGMLALFGRSLYEIITATGPGYLDSLAGLVFFLLIGRWFQSYTFAQLSFERDYHDYFPVGAYRKSAEGEIEAIAVSAVGAGDILVVRPGQVIPTDGVLQEPASAEIDYSFVTGESKRRPTGSGQALFAGGRATDRALTLRVTRPADESYLMQLWRDERRDPEAGVGPPQRMVLAFTVSVILIALLSFAFWFGRDTTTAYRAAVSVLIIACPCAIALTAPFAYGTLQRLLGGVGYYFRSAAAIDRLAGVDTFVFDKTGTLIESSGEAELRWTNRHLATEAGVMLAMCRYSTHPRSRAIAGALTAEGAHPAAIPAPAEQAGQGLHLYWNRRVYRIGSAAFCGLGEQASGTYGMVDGEEAFRHTTPAPRLRPGVRGLLRKLSGQGSVHLLSGDDPPEDNFWRTYLPDDRLHFRMSPFAKQAYIERLRSEGHRVLMVGDGLNDTGALRAADVGVAVSEEDSAFSPACDAIVAAPRLGLLFLVLRTCRRLGRVRLVAYALALVYNLVGLAFAVSGALSPVVAAILMPLSSISIVLVAAGGSYLLYRRDVNHPAD